MDDEQKAAATAAAANKAPDKLTPREAELLAEVLALHPTLTRDEALAALREAGM
jgi:hypothetical protein